jgi:GT2 family glycosyltransferase
MVRTSILIAAHNEGSCLRQTVQSALTAAVGLDCEFVIADDASVDDAPQEVVDEFPQIRLVRHESRRGASPTKDLAARHARGEVLIFLDGHVNPEPDALRQLIDDVEATHGEAIITPAVPHLDASTWTNSRSQIGHGYSLKLSDLGCGWVPQHSLRKQVVGRRTFYESPALIGCALTISRRLYDELRGFDPQMWSWGVEDLDFGLKAWLLGHPILHDPDAVVGHRFRKEFHNFTVPTEHLLANQLRMARKHFTQGVWSEWVESFRKRLCSCHGGASVDKFEHPEGLWALAWDTFQTHRRSVEQERGYLLSRRVRDEFWFAERFGLAWPRLDGLSGGNGNAATRSRSGSGPMALAQVIQGSPEPSPSPYPSPSPSPEPDCPISLIDCFGVAWEGTRIDFFCSAESTAGGISQYEVDVDRDGGYDGSAGHDSRIDGGLILRLPLSLLGAPVDDGRYPVILKVTDSANNTCIFEISVVVGNVPTAIEVSAPEDVQPGAILPLTLETSDPGPDTVRNLSILWGDGSSGTVSGGSGTATHIYAATGEYTIRVTSTDEDGNWSRDYLVDIGDTNAPSLPESFPKIVSADAVVDASTQQAALTVRAVDAQGNEVTGYAWDMNGDDQYLDTTGPAALVSAQSAMMPYLAAVQVTDAAGNVASALFAFADGGPQTPQATKGTYEKLFRDATPDLPPANSTDGSEGWQVHHTKQQQPVISARYLRERGINVHDNQYLRGVPDSVHKEITAAQKAWWKLQAKRLSDMLGRQVSVDEAYRLVDLTDLDAFEQSLDQSYSRWWIAAGSRQKSAVTKIKNLLSGARCKFVIEKASRWRQLGLALPALALFTLIAENAKACENIRNHTPSQLAAWDNFATIYHGKFELLLDRGYLRKSDGLDLKDAFIAYGTALELDREALSSMNGILTKQILTSTELAD